MYTYIYILFFLCGIFIYYIINNIEISEYCVDLEKQERLSNYPYSTNIKKCLENNDNIDKDYKC